MNIPSGRRGRPSKSLTPRNVDDVLTKTAPDRLHHYIVVSLLTGARTEELRALSWDHVHVDAGQDADRGVPPPIEVWRSVREGGDTKTKKSRRTLALPRRCVAALRKQRAQQVAERLMAGPRWQETGLVFTTALGVELRGFEPLTSFHAIAALRVRAHNEQSVAWFACERHGSAPSDSIGSRNGSPTILPTQIGLGRKT